MRPDFLVKTMVYGVNSREEKVCMLFVVCWSSEYSILTRYVIEQAPSSQVPADFETTFCQPELPHLIPASLSMATWQDTPSLAVGSMATK